MLPFILMFVSQLPCLGVSAGALMASHMKHFALLDEALAGLEFDGTPMTGTPLGCVWVERSQMTNLIKVSHDANQ